MGQRPGLWISLVLVLVCGQLAAARAATEPAVEAGSSAGVAPGVTTPPYDPDKAKAASQITDPEAATRAYLAAVSPERRAKTKSYAQGNYVLQVVEFVFSGALMVALIALGISVRFRSLAERLTSVRVLQRALYWIQFFVTLNVISFPLTLYTSYYRETHYGLLGQRLGGFLADQGKEILVGCILGSIFVAIAYGVLRRAPRLWWLWLSGVMIVFLVFAIAIAPVVIQPLFNKFTPVENVAIRTSVLKMAHDHGIPADEVYQMDASTRTDRIRATMSSTMSGRASRS